LLNIRPDEGPRLSLLYVMNFVVLLGLYWGDLIVEAAFLRQVGVEFLPLAIIASAVCSIIAIVIYTAFADRMANTKLLIGILVIGAAGISISLVFLGRGQVIIAYPLLYLIIHVPLRAILTCIGQPMSIASTTRALPSVSSPYWDLPSVSRALWLV